jgi:hypothetical protein
VAEFFSRRLQEVRPASTGIPSNPDDAPDQPFASFLGHSHSEREQTGVEPDVALQWCRTEQFVPPRTVNDQQDKP